MTKYAEQFRKEVFLKENQPLAEILRLQTGLREARWVLWEWVDHTHFRQYSEENRRFLHPLELVVVRDCIRALRLMANNRKEKFAGFSIAKALWDVACGREREDLTPAFWAEIIHLFRGAYGRSKVYQRFRKQKIDLLEGREAAVERSKELDELWEESRILTERYPHGLQSEIIEKRKVNRDRILKALDASDAQWGDWQWQVGHAITTGNQRWRERVVMSVGRSRVNIGRMPLDPRNRCHRTNAIHTCDRIKAILPTLLKWSAASS